MLQQIAPYFGYLASLALILAIIAKTDSKFRLYNIIGTVSFIIYGAVFNAWPVIITNAILLVLNVYYLYKLYNQKEDFDLIEFEGEEKLAQKFVSFYQKDIAGYFPDFTTPALKDNLNFVVLRDVAVANMFSAHVAVNGDATVNINFTIKKYRDYKVGKFIFGKGKQFLISKGVKRVVYDNVFNKGHEKFLLVNGFVKSGEGYVKKLA